MRADGSAPVKGFMTINSKYEGWPPYVLQQKYIYIKKCKIKYWNIACVIQTMIHLPRIQREPIEPLYSVILILAAIIGCMMLWHLMH